KGLKTHPMNIGGAYDFEFGRVKFTHAFHGSSYQEEDGTFIYTGMPGGILLTIDGKTIYHVGDTSLFSDLKMIGEMINVYVACIRIGDSFRMGPEEALMAADWINAKTVVPVHYKTCPVFKQDPESFAKKVRTGKGLAMKVGEEINI